MDGTPRIDDTDLAALAADGERADTELAWPGESWERLKAIGVPGWAIAPELGGQGLPPAALLSGYERLASACLTTSFLLSQREGAVRRIVEYGSEAIHRTWLPALARGERFVTVGLSQLTTSRQHQSPAVSAAPTGAGYRLDGVIPWVTGAERADAFVTGATVADGRQILVLLPRKRDGIHISPPLDLAALRGSLTAQVECHGTEVLAEDVMAGPVERVLGAGRGAGGLETSCLALGLAGAAVDYLGRARPPTARSCSPPWSNSNRPGAGLEQTCTGSARPGAWSQPAATAMRVQTSRLALQATQAALMVAKGTGFVHPHPGAAVGPASVVFPRLVLPSPGSGGTAGGLAAGEVSGPASPQRTARPASRVSGGSKLLASNSRH